MICPRCNREYRAGVTRCTRCGVDLVDLFSPARAGASPDDRLRSEYVVIATTERPLEEGQIGSFLEANGIPVQIRGGSSLREHGLNIGGGVQILVPEEFAEEALELLETAARGDLEIDPTD